MLETLISIILLKISSSIIFKYIRKLDASNKARPCILDNVERSLLCHTCYLGFDQFECPHCDNWNVIPHSCHSRLCNACGVKYAKQLAAKATAFCLVCIIPEENYMMHCPEYDHKMIVKK